SRPASCRAWPGRWSRGPRARCWPWQCSGCAACTSRASSTVVDAPMKQIPLAIGLDTAQSFDSFVPGSNTMALEHLLAMDAASPPVYLWGASGSGKTHLLQSLAQHFQQQGGVVAWFGAADASPWTAD